ncbi:diguanylate cyclase domain-containing protein [Pseudoroseomonas cervicalis]|uniref:sensor domain-containing diguanylate cyclase n=1 Tax=Teichococcus cervicalis TaxID=204525 RepID=UPI0027885A2C|nr:diguanylate cyclase [Pseudoroseomonas cervicalis]MDQ1078101.1 diguanylate cyclase (GGDEF)-like protein [Pseudoroseomonas cervicalis]
MQEQQGIITGAGASMAAPGSAAQIIPPFPVPANEAERLAALRSYQVLDAVCETAFDNIARLAAQITGSPISLITFLDAERQWFKARIGLDLTDAPRSLSFCTHAIMTPDEVMVVPDTRQDPRFAENPYVTNQPPMRFYAGAPLVNPDGAALGTLCVLDCQPRELSGEARQTLRLLAEMVITTLELRRATRRIHDLAVQDALTGIGNRIALISGVEAAIAEARQGGPDGGRGFALVYLDLDGFKAVNDRQGHSAGDRVLQEVARCLAGLAPPGALAARLGGDEFALLLPGAGQEAAEQMAERARAAIAARMAEIGQAVTASVGAVGFAQPPASADAALASADLLMYAAKAGGKNRVQALPAAAAAAWQDSALLQGRGAG